MSTPLDQLIRLVPPPSAPISPGTPAGFERIEASLGTRLPQDYKELIHTYGDGMWLNFYWIINPFVKHYAAVWLDPGHWFMKAHREGHEQWPEFDLYPYWPEPGGLLPWGGNDNGGDLFWQTDGTPDAWPTVHKADRTPEYDHFDKSCTELLLEAVTRKNEILTEVVREDAPLFVPILP